MKTDISEAVYQTKMGQMIKMKQHNNARNNPEDLNNMVGGKNGISAGVYINGPNGFINVNMNNAAAMTHD